jgi:hypothetical protein
MEQLNLNKRPPHPPSKHGRLGSRPNRNETAFHPRGPSSRSPIHTSERQQPAERSGGHGVAGEPVPEREGDPRPPLPVLPRQRSGTVPASPPSLLSAPVRFPLPIGISSRGDMVFARREFVKKNYADIKSRNPALPFLIRECSGVQPQLWARYGTRPSPFPSLPPPATRDLI